MQTLRIRKHIESETLHLPELRPLIGKDVEIIVHEETAPPQPDAPKRSIVEFLASLPPGPRLFKTADEVDRYLEEERNSWER